MKKHTFLYDSYVIAEDIEISEDMTYVFTQSDAKNKLSCKFFYPDGSQIPTILKMKPANSA